MKITDFMPRCGFLETLLTGNDLIGAEIGVDIGAHAESLLINCDIKKLHLIDPWKDEYCFGYVNGRLATKGYLHRIEFHRAYSLDIANKFEDEYFNFIFFDQLQDYGTVKSDLSSWWPKIKQFGLAAWRGYFDYPGMKRAVDEFACVNNIDLKLDEWTREVILCKK